MKKQQREKNNRIGSYLAVTAGVGCAASAANGQIHVVDLSGLSSATGGNTLPSGDSSLDFNLPGWTNTGFLQAANSASFYTDAPGLDGNPNSALIFTGGSSAFPANSASTAQWFYLNAFDPNSSGAMVGENWVAFKDTDDRFGWLSFTLDSLTANAFDGPPPVGYTPPLVSYNHFVYDESSTSPANAISLSQATAAAVPEPSSLVLLALGATGLATRRQRKKAA